MRIVRFSDGSSPCYGALDDGSTRIVGLKGDPLFAAVEPSGRVFELDEVRLLSPVIPRSKVVGVAGNYSDQPVPDADRTRPPLFLKANTSVIGPDDPIAIPAWSDDVVFEGELAVVIKSLAKDVPVEEAHQVVLGYTVANDATARDAVDGGPWARGKSFDTACPLGPWITVDPGLDPTDLAIRSTVNGAPAQDGSSADMVWNVFELVSYASMAFTLLPGDVVIPGAAPSRPATASRSRSRGSAPCRTRSCAHRGSALPAVRRGPLRRGRPRPPPHRGVLRGARTDYALWCRSQLS